MSVSLPRWEPARVPVAAMLLLLGGCFLPGFEKVEGGGGGGAAGGANPVCESSTFEAPGQGGTSAADTVDFFAAIRTVDLGEKTLAERPGFDLDRVCTCCDGCEQALICNAPAGAEGRECDAVDGAFNDGRDNNVAKFLAGVVGSSVGIDSSTLSNNADAGEWTLLIRVFDYNGLADDSQVSVAIYTTPGLLVPPVWDGSDVFSVRSDSVVADSNDIQQPTIVNHNAYVTEGTLVGVFGASSPLSLSLTGGFKLDFTYAIFQARIDASNGFALRDGVVGGIWGMAAVFKTLGALRENGMPIICTDSPGYANLVKEPLCLLRDSLPAPQPVTCDGISFGMAFTADPVAAPVAVEPLVDTSTPCAPEVDPAADVCP